MEDKFNGAIMTTETYAYYSKMYPSRRLLMSTTVDGAGLRRVLQVAAAPERNPEPGVATVDSPSAASPPFSPPRQVNSSAFNTLDPTVVIILVVLLFALICAAFLNSFMRWLLRRAGAEGAARTGRRGQVLQSSVQGLHPKTLAALPVFAFKAADKLSKESVVECTICLSEFEENEKLRLLPKCSHVFHLDCIDMWLLSHVSCPVCRDGVADDEDNLNSTGVVDNQRAGAGHEGLMILIHDQHGYPSLTTAAAVMGSGTSNIRPELTLMETRNESNRNESRNPAIAPIIMPPQLSQEATGSHRSLRSKLTFKFPTENFLSGRWQAASSSSAAAPTTSATVTSSAHSIEDL